MKIPGRTTLKQRIEFYEYALKSIQKAIRLKDIDFLCHIADRYYKNTTGEFGIDDIKKLFPELYKNRNVNIYKGFNILWNSNETREVAIKKALSETKKKMK